MALRRGDDGADRLRAARRGQSHRRGGRNWCLHGRISYVVAALAVLVLYADQIPMPSAWCFSYAFSPTAATGGFAGAAIMMAMRYGVARGIFPTEAGLGTAGIAPAAGKSSNAVRSSLVGMMGTFIDTLIVFS